MVASARLLTSVEPDQRQRFSELAAAQGVSSSRLLARLVHRALIENPEAKVEMFEVSFLVCMGDFGVKE